MVTNIGADQFPSVIGTRFKGSRKKKENSCRCRAGERASEGVDSDGKKAQGTGGTLRHACYGNQVGKRDGARGYFCFLGVG
jgi:hypothetical protein